MGTLTQKEKTILQRAIIDAIDIYSGFDLKGRISEWSTISDKLDLDTDFIDEINSKIL